MIADPWRSPWQREEAYNGAYLVGLGALWVCNTSKDNPIPKGTVISSYYKEESTGHNGKTAPESIKDIKINVQDPVVTPR